MSTATKSRVHPHLVKARSETPKMFEADIRKAFGAGVATAQDQAKKAGVDGSDSAYLVATRLLDIANTIRGENPAPDMPELGDLGLDD